MNVPQYNPVIPREIERVRPQTVTVVLKNAGSTPTTVFDIDAKAVRIGVGEKKPVLVAVKHAERLRDMQAHGAHLLVINESAVVDAADEFEEIEEPAPKPKRVRLTATLPRPEEALSDYETARDAANAEFVAQSERDAKRLGRRNPRGVIYPEITTPEQLLVYMQESEAQMPHQHLQSVAFRILPEGTFREHQPNRAQIMRALEAAMVRRR